MHHQSFYSTSASIIALLFLVLVVERGSFRARRTRSRVLTVIWALVTVGTVVFIVGGEFVAIDALESSSDSDTRRLIVVWAVRILLAEILILGVGVALAPFLPQVKGWARSRLLRGNGQRGV
jgi:ABC-type uncharacterized transport system YnjBCD permease subunit